MSRHVCSDREVAKGGAASAIHTLPQVAPKRRTPAAESLSSVGGLCGILLNGRGGLHLGGLDLYTLVEEDVGRLRYHLVLVGPCDRGVIEVVPLAVRAFAYPPVGRVVTVAQASGVVHNCVELVLHTARRGWPPDPRRQIEVHGRLHEGLHLLQRTGELLGAEALEVDQEAVGGRPEVQLLPGALEAAGAFAADPVLLRQLLQPREGVEAVLEAHLQVPLWPLRLRLRRRGLLRLRQDRALPALRPLEVQHQRPPLGPELALRPQAGALLAGLLRRGQRGLEAADAEEALKPLGVRQDPLAHLLVGGLAREEGEDKRRREHREAAARGALRRGLPLHARVAELVVVRLALLQGHLEGPDAVVAAHLAHGLAAAEESQEPLVVEVGKREAPPARTLGLGGEGLQDLRLEVPEGRDLRDGEASPRRGGLRVSLQEHRDLEDVRRAGHRQGEIHHRIELQGLAVDLGEGDLGAHLELEDVHDPRAVPPQVPRPRLGRDLGVAPPLRRGILHDGTRVRRPVHVLVESVQEEREHLLRVVLLIARELWSLLGDQLLELGRGQGRVRVRPHPRHEIREAGREPALHAERRVAQLPLEVAGPVVLPQQHRVGERLQRRVHETGVAQVEEAAGPSLVAGAQGLRAGLGGATQGGGPEHEMQGGLVLDVVRLDRARVLQLLAGEDQALLLGRDALLLLDLALDLPDGVGRLDLQLDGLARQCLRGDLEAPPRGSLHAGHQVQHRRGGVLARAAREDISEELGVLQLLPGVDQALLVGREAGLGLDLVLDVGYGVPVVHVDLHDLPRQGLDDDHVAPRARFRTGG
mmetsp:Transcript_25978/g.57263  ORF Transcript_25978/g.57263 Transcript_25978/m.57263 type:complete len:815 (+) Transcript_25978:3-2447(+)